MENFTLLKEKENPLFNRKEIKFVVDSEVTPSNTDVEKFISEKFSALPETIKIKGIYGKFGAKIFTVNANIYKTLEDKEKTEPKSKKEKEAEAKQAEVVAAPEIAPAPETPVETPVEAPAEQPAPVEEPKQEEPPKEEVKG